MPKKQRLACGHFVLVVGHSGDGSLRAAVVRFCDAATLSAQTEADNTRALFSLYQNWAAAQDVEPV
jgi:hypothetical protein